MDDPQDALCEVVVTAPDEEWLLGLTRRLVERRLAACGHHQAVRSVYTWEGRVHDERETRVALHTRASCVPAVVAAVEAEHPYQVPCVVSLPVLAAAPAYRAWVLDATDDPGRPPAGPTRSADGPAGSLG